MSMLKEISVKNTNVHNLKSVSVNIPRDALVVITGPSGSGKSSLAFDTIYVEGQRRYIESLSSYARQFLGQFQPPDVESITGLSPAIAIDQKSTSNNPRSTVGTVTEIYDYLRILFARIGESFCPQCKSPIIAQTNAQISNSIASLKNGTKIQILSPIIKNKKGEHKELLVKFAKQGFNRIRLNGLIMQLTDDIVIEKNKSNQIDLVIDRIVVKDENKSRISESVELALRLGEGHLICLTDEEERFFSEKSYCAKCDKYFQDLEPRTFSFNSPLGACKSCNGLGTLKTFSEDTLVKFPELSLNDGAIPLVNKHSFLNCMVQSVFKTEKISLNTPYKSLDKNIKNILIQGSETIYTYKFESENSSFNFKKSFPGLINWLDKKYNESDSDKTRENLESFMSIRQCSICKGNRLNEFALSTFINKLNIMDICHFPCNEALLQLKSLKFTGEKHIIGSKLLKEVNTRLEFLCNVGLDYLSLNRAANTLSGGENQRIRLATQIGSALSGVLYVLDEPSIGLHQKDNVKLIETLKSLRDIGNTVLVVEHDLETMEASDWIIDMGPGAGQLGGHVVAEGSVDKIKKSKESITGKYLSGRLKIEVPKSRRSWTDKISLKCANLNNLKKIDVEFPLGVLTCVTGVSGSGKSTLIKATLVPAIKNYLAKEKLKNIGCHSISGMDQITSVIELDQSPIGRTPKSNPATYSGAFDLIRTLYATSPDSKIKGYKSGRFSFNVKGGRCESCEGNGQKKIEMHFLPDVFIECEECKGKRYNSDTLNILFKTKNIFDVLKMTIDEGCLFFENHPKLGHILCTMRDVGLGYMQLGQPATTLSGGEAQRLKLASELARRPRGKCLYVLDEPTTGLHFEDINVLIKALNRLVDQGHSMIVIEHNLDVIKVSDYVIDLGPEGGTRGGVVVARGTPEEVAKVKSSFTGMFLKKYL